MQNVQKYPVAMRLFHALVAIMMIATLLVGWQLEGNMDLMMLHKSLGVGVLILVVLRLANRLRSSVPASVNTKGSLQYMAEKIVHGLLYLCMLGLPIMGWLTSNAYGYPAGFFGLFNLPTLIGKNEGLAEQLGELHEFGANVFFILLLVHVAGALAHLVMHKQNIFKRMM
ncbi:MAG: cytochrome b [Formosimonas sp.]